MYSDIHDRDGAAQRRVAGKAAMNPAGEISREERALGAYLGFAVGDALGATVEFMTALEIKLEYGVHRNIVGGGWLRLKPGRVTDDTQMCVALGRTLVRERGLVMPALAAEFVAWMRSKPVDIGNTCRRGIRRYLQDGSFAAKAAQEDGGNGAAMRNLPVVLATIQSPRLLEEWSLAQARFTHNHPASDAATLLFARVTRAFLLGESRERGEELARQSVRENPEFRFEPWPGRTSGYVVDTVQTVLDGFLTTTSFEECLLKVVNRGGDADTAGALAGQLAGAYYGAGDIPARWLKKLEPSISQTIRQQTVDLLLLSREVVDERMARLPASAPLG